jgi:hypothetical protein
VGVGTVTDVNTPDAGTLFPIAILSIVPVLPDDIATVVPDKFKFVPAFIATTPVALIVTALPPEICALPPTNKLDKVPNLVRLLFKIPLPRVVLLRTDVPDIKKFDNVLTLPLESTVNPGLSNPDSDLRYF